MSTLTADPPTTSHAATPPAAAQVQPATSQSGGFRGPGCGALSLMASDLEVERA